MTITYERPKLAEERSVSSDDNLTAEAAARVAVRAVSAQAPRLEAIYGDRLVGHTAALLSQLVRCLTLQGGNVEELKALIESDPFAHIPYDDVRELRRNGLRDLLAEVEEDPTPSMPEMDTFAAEVATTALALQANSEDEMIAREAADVLGSHYAADVWEMATGSREIPDRDALIGARALAAV